MIEPLSGTSTDGIRAIDLLDGSWALYPLRYPRQNSKPIIDCYDDRDYSFIIPSEQHFHFEVFHIQISAFHNLEGIQIPRRQVAENVKEN